MGILRKLSEYLFIKKRDPNEPRTRNMRYMNGVNRLSLIMFILALVIIFLKLVVFKKH